jgi:hydrogenase nickel incorporation protein HypA/HybF
MHELSVCQAMIDQIENLVVQHRARYVEAVDVEIGELSGIDAGLFADAFSIMKEGTCAESAILNARPLPPWVQCIECNQRTATRAHHLVCGSCGGYRVTVVQGNELRLRNVKLNIGN